MTLEEARREYNELRTDMEHLEDHIDLMNHQDPDYHSVRKELRDITIKVNKLKRFIAASEETREV